MATIKMIAAAASGCEHGASRFSRLTRPDRAAVDELPRERAFVLVARLAHPRAMEVEEISDLLGQASRENGWRPPQCVRE